MNKSSIPDVLRPTTRTTMSNVDIYTSVLEPINKTQTRVVWNLRQTGILNAGSRIVMSVHPDNATAQTSFLPLGCGIASCIETATLRVGTRVIAQTEHFSENYFAHRSVHTREQKRLIDMPLDGGCGEVSNSPNFDGKYAMDTGSAIYSNKTTALVPTKYKPVVSQTDCPTYSIALDDLFVMMRGLQLPLFCMEEVVSIELLLRQQKNPATDKTLMFSAAPTSTSTSYGLDNFALHIDYLQYDTATMERVKSMVYSENGMPFIYDDVSTTTTQIPAVPQPADNTTTTNSIVREVGSAGLKVRNVLVMEKKSGVGNTLFGNYRSEAPVHPPKYNWRYNNKIVYPRAVFNTSFMRSETEQVLKFPMSVPNVMYSQDVENEFYANKNGGQNLMFDAATTMEGQSPQVLSGTYFITALNLEKGKNGLPTEIIHKNILYERENTFSRNDYEARDLLFFVEHERSWMLRNGVLLVSA